MALFPVTPLDRAVYQQELKDFLPKQMIDMHTHVFLERIRQHEVADPGEIKRTVTWPSLVARENPVEDLAETYHLMFPGKQVTPLMFSLCEKKRQLPESNRYIEACAQKTGYPALYFSHPEQTAEEVERAILQGGFLGVKSYLDLSPKYIPEAEIRIFDFFPPHQLSMLNRLGLIMMLHIPRNGRLKDPVNLAQILEITQRYPNIRLIIAHIGRAYCENDIGEAFDILAPATRLMFDFSANTSENAMVRLLEHVPPERILFGSDLPILRMRMRRIEENNTYINLVPPGLYGDPRQDAHLREVSAGEGERLTFFMYEEILAFKRAATSKGLDRAAIEKIFYGNAQQLIDQCRARVASLV